MNILLKGAKRITPLLLACFYLVYYTSLFFTAPADRHGFLFIGGLFGCFMIVVFLVIDYGMWKVWKGKWYWLWLIQIIFIMLFILLFNRI
jgi:hypothetical protein